MNHPCRTAPAGEAERFCRLHLWFDRIDVAFQAGDVRGTDLRASGAACFFRGCEFRAECAQVALDLFKDRPDFPPGLEGAAETENAVQLVHRPEGLDPQRVFGDTTPPEKRGLPPVTGLRDGGRAE